MPASAKQHFDLAVIGSGPAGYKAAIAATQMGAKVALIEKSLPGGTCLNQGCVPKATLMRIARLISDVNQLSGRGITGKINVDFTQAVAHKNTVINNIRSGLTPWLRQLGVSLIKGGAQFIDQKTIGILDENNNINPQTLIHADKFIIATGARPIEHDICVSDGSRIINSRQFMFNLETLPQNILFLGGGSIGTELGYLLHQFGSVVTIAEQADRLLNKACIPLRASHILERKFKQLGINVKTNLTVVAQHRVGDDIEVTFSDGSIQLFSHIFVAIGRQPNTESLQLGNAKVTTTPDGFISVNEHLETASPGIYAIGDVKHGPMTANAAFHDAKIAAKNAISGNHYAVNYNRVPIVIETAIPIASVGLTEERAEAAGFEPDVARFNLAGSTKGRINQDSEGYIEVVHDEETGQLLGGSIVGPQAGEMIHMLEAACQSERGLWFFTDINYSHPSWIEELENAIGSCVSEFSKSEDPIFKPGIYATP